MVTKLVSKYYLPDLELPCGHPGDIEHGLTDWNGTGRAVARYACYQGYYLVGPPRLVSSSVVTRAANEASLSFTITREGPLTALVRPYAGVPLRAMVQRRPR